MLEVFSRKEYQAEVGNLSHIHLLGNVCQLSEQSQIELFDLTRNNVVDIIKPEEVDKIIKEGIIEHKDYVIQVQLDGMTYLIHICNSPCLVPHKYGNLICCAKNDRKSEENTKHVLIDLPNNLSKLCIEFLEKSGLSTPIRNNRNKVVSFKSNLGFFIKKIPPWKYDDDKISPCETRTYTACRSMKNIQYLSGSGGSCKYCYKCVGEIDKNNYCTVSTSADGILIRREIFLHNTKRVTSDKF